MSVFLDSHEARLQGVEHAMSELVAMTSSTDTKVDGMATILEKIDTKLDSHMTSLEGIRANGQQVAMRVHDLETRAKSEEKHSDNVKYAFWTAVAGIAVELVLHLLTFAKKGH